MEFIEATAFTKYIYDYLSDDEYLGLQSFLLKYPESGVVLVMLGKCAGRCPGKVKAAACE